MNNVIKNLEERYISLKKEPLG